jgi:membrane-associated phospholipid phosphatase
MSKKVGSLVCNIAYGLYMAAGALCPFVCKDKNGNKSLMQTAASLLCSAAAVQTLKLLIPERRPDTGQKGSFPSGHSANTMAIAAICSVQRPEQTVGWYLSAISISLARIALRRHHVRDVVVGSLLGVTVAALVARNTK